jgi:hypothetical protein
MRKQTQRELRMYPVLHSCQVLELRFEPGKLAPETVAKSTPQKISLEAQENSSVE